MDNLLVRKAQESELKTVQGLNTQLFLHDQPYHSTLHMNWPYEEIGEKYFRDRISGEKGVCFVAEIEGKVVGYLAGAMIEPYSYRDIKKEFELENTLVKEEFRGKRIGEKLFNEFIKWSKKHGAERVKVSASVDNEEAIKFYKRVGFIPYAAELEYEIK